MKLNQSVFMLPKVYEKSDTFFWEDPYISKKLLAAHLDSSFEGASRSFTFIEESVSWIHTTFPHKKYPKILDLGCGPGLYTEQFVEKGYQVTGIDISSNSIDYAKDSAKQKNLNIKYIQDNYVSNTITDMYDIVVMIYCDYGALSKIDREMVIKKVYQCLHEGGIFIFDVFSKSKYDVFKEYQNWEYVDGNGFWMNDHYIALQRNKKYEDLITLEQTIVISDNQVQKYNIWNTFFTQETLIEEVKKVGFTVEGVYGDVTGKSCTENEDTICMILKK